MNSTVDLSLPVKATDIVPVKSPYEHSRNQLGSSLGCFKGLPYDGSGEISRTLGLAHIALVQEAVEDRREEYPYTPGENRRIILGEENSCSKLDDKSRGTT